MNFLKNLLFYFSVIVFTVIIFFTFGIVLIFIHLFFSKEKAQKTLRYLIVGYGRSIIYGFGRILASVKFIDSSQGKIAEDPCIYVVNHRSASDAFLMGVLSGEFVQVVNLWPFKIPILGMCAKLAGYLNVRSLSFEEFSQECGRLIEQNVSILGFPEGTRSTEPQMGQFRGALFRVAKEFRLKIVPICITGNDDKPSKNSLMIQPGTIRIYKLPALSFDEYGHMTNFELKNHVRDIIQVFFDHKKGPA